MRSIHQKPTATQKELWRLYRACPPSLIMKFTGLTEQDILEVINGKDEIRIFEKFCILSTILERDHLLDMDLKNKIFRQETQYEMRKLKKGAKQ